MRALTSLDSMFLATEDGRTVANVSSLAIMDRTDSSGKPLTRKAIQELFAERLHLLPPLRWRLVDVPLAVGHPWWADCGGDVDLDFHVRETAVVSPGDRQALETLVARLSAHPMDRSRPLWEVYLIHGLQDDKVALLTKLHHAAVDGMSGGEVLNVIFDTTAEGRDLVPPPGYRRERDPGQLSMLARAIADMPRRQLKTVKATRNTLTNLDHVATLRSVPGVGRLGRAIRRMSKPTSGPTILDTSLPDSPKLPFNGKITAHRRVALTSLPLDEVKDIKNHYEATVNDVVVALCAGALRRWLTDRAELPEQPLVAAIPASVRSQAEFGTFGNRVGTMLTALPTDEADPVVRLRKCRAGLRAAKERHQAVPASLLRDANDLIPPILFGRAIRDDRHRCQRRADTRRQRRDLQCARIPDSAVLRGPTDPGALPGVDHQRQLGLELDGFQLHRPTRDRSGRRPRVRRRPTGSGRRIRQRAASVAAEHQGAEAVKRLSSVDAQFLAMEDGRVHTHVCQLTIIEGKTGNGTKVDGQRIRDLLAERIELMPPFRWRIKEIPFGIDYPVVIADEAFDLDSHIWESALPAPGTDQQLGEAVGDIASRPLDRARSLWELHVIHGLADDRVALVTKVHHAIVDGVSGNELLGALLDPTPKPVADADRPSVARQAVGHAPSDARLLARAIGSLPMQPVRMARGVPMVLRHIDQLPTMRNLPGAGLIARAADHAERIATRNKDGRNLEHPNAAAPKVSFGGRISAQRRFAFGTLSLSDIKAVKNAVPGATVNDVVVALCAGALRRRMMARGDDVSTPLVSLVPVSVRTGDEQHFGNQISSMIVPIPTDECDPRRRLARAHGVLRTAKERHRAIPAKMLTAANHTVPPALLTRTARVISMTTGAGWIRPPFNVTISNIPGSRNELFCAGARVVSQHPVNVLLDGVGLSITLLSYEDRLDFGLIADRELLPDVWCLADELTDELRTVSAEFEVAQT